MLKVDILKSNSKLAPALIFLALGGITGCNLFGGGVNNDLRMANNNFDYILNSKDSFANAVAESFNK